MAGEYTNTHRNLCFDVAMFQYIHRCEKHWTQLEAVLKIFQSSLKSFTFFKSVWLFLQATVIYSIVEIKFSKITKFIMSLVQIRSSLWGLTTTTERLSRSIGTKLSEQKSPTVKPRVLLGFILHNLVFQSCRHVLTKSVFFQETRA